MSNEQVQVTQWLIKSGQSNAGGWTRQQLEIIGVPWPPKRGWRLRAEGNWILEREAIRFIKLRGVTKKSQRKFQAILSDFETLDSESQS